MLENQSRDIATAAWLKGVAMVYLGERRLVNLLWGSPFFVASYSGSS